MWLSQVRRGKGNFIELVVQLADTHVALKLLFKVKPQYKRQEMKYTDEELEE